MIGEPIESVKNGIQLMISSLRKDPQALETAYVSLVTFSDTVSQLVPLTEVMSFQTPNLVASGGTAIGAALLELSNIHNREVNKGSFDEKGDWKPLVFMMTDGMPTDDVLKGLTAFSSCEWGMVVACAAGPAADTKFLRRITEIVLSLDTCDSNSIQAFFRWVTFSVSSTSRKIESGRQLAGLEDLPPPPPEINLLKF
jgi:uncharacterized protein YegL